MAIPRLDDMILQYLAEQRVQGRNSIGARELAEHLQISRSSLNRHLSKLTDDGVLTRRGIGPSTVY
jgi:DNA-binding IclR family transcriptional regulator